MAGNASSDKAALRQEAEARRRALSPEVVRRWGGEVQRHLAAHPLFSERVVRAVAVYDAQAFEVPLGEFVLELGSRGGTCVFPRVVRGSRELAFHPPDDDWQRGPFGLREPAARLPQRAIETIDVFIVPGVAFTLGGARLGRGGGYYDATLARRNRDAVCIGVCFDCNVVPDLPMREHDVWMDWIATERGVFAAQRR